MNILQHCRGQFSLKVTL